MTLYPAADPACPAPSDTNEVAAKIQGKSRDIGGFSVMRVLPSAARRMVGPFVFFDHMGPATFLPGQGLAVRPHPHIHLATVTYLFEGEILHRDSLGSLQAIQPGAINWMTAGRGIVHSERMSEETVARGSRLHGIQLWLALPRDKEESEPSFVHHPAHTLPLVVLGAVHLRVLSGSAYGVTSPVSILSPLFYVDATMPAGSSLTLPQEYSERAVYVAQGSIESESEVAEVGTMLVFSSRGRGLLKARSDSRVLLLGGEPLEGKRFVFWNFVSSSKERIEQAKSDWKNGRFPTVPGDEEEFIPLPE